MDVTEPTSPIEPPSNQAAPPPADTVLRFKTDTASGVLTVLVVDAVTRKVIRTISPDELTLMGYDRTLEIVV